MRDRGAATVPDQVSPADLREVGRSRVAGRTDVRAGPLSLICSLPQRGDPSGNVTGMPPLVVSAKPACPEMWITCIVMRYL